MKAPGNIFLPVSLPTLTTHRVNGHEFRFRNLPAADNFLMGNNEGEEESFGDEHPRHPRSIAPFALAEYPVTQALWAAVYELAGQRGLTFDAELLRPNPSYFPGPNRPVENVSWDDVHEFCRVLNELLEKPKGHFCLPSEAEWEYAAREGKRDTLYAGSNQLAEVGWYYDNSGKEIMPVGLLAPNDFGLYDLSGNVREWCEDDWHSGYGNRPSNRRARNNDSGKSVKVCMLRYDSWVTSLKRVAAPAAFPLFSDDRYFNYGFRLAAPV